MESATRRIRLRMNMQNDRVVDHLQQSHQSYSRWCSLIVMVMAACSPVTVRGQIAFPSTPSIVIVPSPVATPTILAPVAQQPVAAPVVQPVAAPVAQPIVAPVAQPVAAPVKPPTPRPTFPPTKSPILSPTNWPSRGPSETPSQIPTVSPSKIPTGRPSDAPSLVPSRSPTILTTTNTPTFQPSLEPSSATLPPASSGVPSIQPTAAFSGIAPSLRPTLQPTMLPSSFPLSSASVNVVMLLVATKGVLRGRSAIDFETATAAHIKLTTENNGYNIANFSVETTISTQKVEPEGSGGRKLQSAQPLQIALSVLIGYQNSTLNDSFDPVSLVEEAFNSAEERDSYIARLKEKNTEFSSLETVSLLVEGEVPVEEKEMEPKDSKNLGIIIGAVVGGVLGLACAAYIFSRRSQQYQGGGSKQVHAETALTANDAPNRIQTEILVDRQDDVSTLGDPVFTGIMSMDIGDRDERTASVADDYDYAKEYLLGQARERMLSVDSGPSGKTSGTFSRVFADDASFEQQYEDDEHLEDKNFEVHVPPGKLGMVIDTPNGGVPIVHAIKPESVLADKVIVGDRLLSVDGEDVTSMTAVQVSKLISVKSNKDRTLKFVRNQNVIESLGR